jgi:hypothetical protein
MIENHKINIFGLRHLFWMLLFLCCSTFRAQNNPQLPFPINNPLNPGQNLPQSFDLGDPTSLKQSIVYDPSTGTYIFSETLDNLREKSITQIIII